MTPRRTRRPFVAGLALAVAALCASFVPQAWAQTAVRYLTVYLGIGGSSTGSIVFENAANANKVTVQPGTTTSSYTVRLPTGPGLPGQAITTDGGTPQQLGFTTINPTHALLSAAVTDTTSSAVARGSLVTGQGASPTWAQLVIGAANRALVTTDGVDVSWGQIVSAMLNITTTSCTNQVVTAISSGGVGTCTTITSAYVSGTTGSGNFVLQGSPSLTTPNIGAATGTSVTLSSLTAGRMALVSTSGLINDDSGALFDQSTDIATFLGGITLGSVSTAGRGLVNIIDTVAAGGDTVMWKWTGTAPSETAGNNHIGMRVLWNPGNSDPDHVIAAGYFGLGNGTGSSGRKFALIAEMLNNASPSNATMLGTCPSDTAQGNTNVSHAICAQISNNDQRAIAVHGNGGGAADRVGVLGEVAAAGQSGIGVWGNYVSGAGTAQFGGLFTADHASTFPTFGTDAALAASNGASTDAILLAYDSTTVKVGVYDGGLLQLASDVSFSWSSTTAAGGAQDTFLNRHSAGVLRFGSSTTNINYLLGGGGAVASATAMPVPTGNVFHVTGTTNITSITSTNFATGTVITLVFDGILTFTDGSNLKLAGNFVTSADDTITLVYDGTNWYEIGRAVN